MMCTIKYGFTDISPFQRIKGGKIIYWAQWSWQLGSRCLSGSHNSCVSHVPFQQWTNSYWAIMRGDVTVSYITKMQTDKIQIQPFIHLGHGFSYISPQTVSDKALIWTFAVWAIKHEKYNLSSFHSFSLVHLHLSSYVLYVSKGHEGTSTPLTRWRCDGEACEGKQ